MSLVHTTNSISTRGDINVATLVCVPCKVKHGGAATCYAHTIIDGKAICVFCEDGEPCMHEQRQARAAKNPHVIKTVPAPPQQSPIQLLADRLKAEGLPDPDIHAALVAQGYKARDLSRVLPVPATQPKEKPMQTVTRPNGHAPAPEIKLCGREGCGRKLTRANHSGFCATHFGDSRKKANGGTPGRVCSTPGCGQSLRSDNKSGVCKPCSKGETKAAHRGTKRANHETAARRRPAQEKLERYVAQHTSTLQLQVSEAQLDRLLNSVDWNLVIVKLPAEMKQQLANHYFAAGLDQVEAKAEAAA